MELSDVVALYAAVVATAVAIFQITEIRGRSRYVVVTPTQYFGDETTWIEVKIENRGGHPSTLHYVAFGTCRRRWRTLWRLDEDSFVGISEFESDNDETPKAGKSLDGTRLQPGCSVTGLVLEKEIAWAARETTWGKASSRVRDRFILIEHSQSDRPILKRIKLEPI